jgi:hypothetical protein
LLGYEKLLYLERKLFYSGNRSYNLLISALNLLRSAYLSSSLLLLYLFISEPNYLSLIPLALNLVMLFKSPLLNLLMSPLLNLLKSPNLFKSPLFNLFKSNLFMSLVFAPNLLISLYYLISLNLLISLVMLLYFTSS